MTAVTSKRYQPQAEIVEVPADVDGAWEAVYAKGWTDGLPVVPATLERVEAMLSGTSLSGDTVVAELDPRRAKATVEKIAINAVMAGCRPEYMPVLIAAVRALADPAYNLHGVSTTTNPVGPMTLINGPIRDRIEVNSGRNALGPGVRANATIGRAVKMIMMNVGGAVPQDSDKAILGLAAKYTCCLGEDEEGSPWEPFHVERGFGPDESAVTMFGIASEINVCLLAYPEQALETQLDRVANALPLKGSNNQLLGDGDVIVIVPRGWAHLLNDAGYDKDRLKQYLWERGSIPEEDYPPVSRMPMASAVIENGRVYVTTSPEKIRVLVAGGPEPYHVLVMHSFGDNDCATEKIPE